MEALTGSAKCSPSYLDIAHRLAIEFATPMRPILDGRQDRLCKKGSTP